MRNSSFYSTSERGIYASFLEVSFTDRLNPVAGDAVMREVASSDRFLGYVAEPLLGHVWVIATGTKVGVRKAALKLGETLVERGAARSFKLLGCTQVKDIVRGRNTLLSALARGTQAAGTLRPNDTHDYIESVYFPTLENYFNSGLDDYVPPSAITRSRGTLGISLDIHHQSEVECTKVPGKYVIEKDGSVTAADLPLALHSMIDAGVSPRLAWNAAHALGKALQSSDKVFFKAEEITWFIGEWLAENGWPSKDALKFLRYNRTGFLVLKGRLLERSMIRKTVTNELTRLKLNPTSQQVKDLADSVFQAVKRLSVNSYGDEFSVDVKLVEELCKTVVGNLPAVPIVIRLGAEKASGLLLDKAKSLAYVALQLSDSRGVSQGTTQAVLRKMTRQACLSLLHSQLVRARLVPVGSVVSDAGLLQSAIGKNTHGYSKIVAYCRLAIKLYSKPSNIRDYVSLLKATARLSSSLR
ncbi:MAG: hypothetical protein M1357_00995 [Candidatus Marsarchaeota archaeon]|nr:hypothetical protein [Candidatus Marsarchaeota archaeon]